MLPITRYMIKDKLLSPWVKFLWSFDQPNGNVSNKLLPTDTIDILINLSGTMIYQTKTCRYLAPAVHINGLRNEHSMIHHTGNIKAYGISFYAYGLYPFIQGKLSATKGRIADLHTLSSPFAEKLNADAIHGSEHTAFQHIENVLRTEIKANEADHRNVKLIEEFLRADHCSTIHEYCNSKNMNIKTLERITKKYTGDTPKTLRRLRRFQTASNQLVHQRQLDLTSIAHNNYFSDQSHFIRDFVAFAGLSPRVFQIEKKSIKENAIYKII